MKRFIFLLLFGVLIHGTVFAGKIPDSIGGIKLGQKIPQRQEFKNVKFAGFKGSLLVFPSENNAVDTLRFWAVGCDADNQAPCKTAMKRLKGKYIKELGKPKVDQEKSVVWDQDGRRLTLGWDYAGGQVDAIFIYLERADDTKPGGVNDGFKAFYPIFTQAFNNSDREQLVSMMQFPFEGNCSVSIARPDSFDGNLKKIVGTVYSEFKEVPFFDRVLSRMYFSSYMLNGVGFNKINGNWYAVGFYCSE